MDPAGCNVLLVGSTYLNDSGSGLYVARTACPHVTSYGRKYLTGPCHCERYRRPQDPAAVREENRQALEFIQALLETYSHVTAVTCGQIALSSLHTQHPGRNTILLIDLDHFAHKEDEAPKHDSGVELEDMYGLDFLKVVADELQAGLIKQVYPIVCSHNPSPDLMTHCLNLGAADYLVKPIGSEVVKTLWLNVLRRLRKDGEFQVPVNALEMARLRQCNGEFLEERLAETFSRDATLAEMIVNYYTPPFRRVDPLDFPRLDTNAAQERRQFLCLQLHSWSFCPHDLSDDDLLRCVEIIFVKVMSMDGLETIHATQDTLHRFILAIRNSYHATNPYHDFYHAVDVLQATFYILNTLGIIPNDKKEPKELDDATQKRHAALHRVFRAKDVFALMVASLGHDVGHPGVNNFYMINARTPLAELYNDQSVLENYHATSLFLLMRKHGLNFYDNDQSPVFKDFRSTVVNAILATDMGTHFDYVRQIHEQSDRIQKLANVDTPVTDSDRRLLTAAIIKCADICNATRPFKIARQWSQELLREFAMQSELEKKMGVPVSMPVDDSPVAQAKSQIDFISALAMPLFAAVSQVFPELQYTVDQLSSNKTTWEEIRASELTAQSSNANGASSISIVGSSRRANERVLGEEATAHARRLSLPYPGLKKNKYRSNSQLSVKSEMARPRRPLSGECTTRTPNGTMAVPTPPATVARRLSSRLSVCSQRRFSDAVADYLFS